MRKIDLTGDVYGDWLVLSECDQRKNGKVYWKCKCLACGKIGFCGGNNLRTGKTKNCGCKLSETRSKARLHDLSGHKFGLLTVAHRARDAETYGRTMWKCVCECGKETTVAGEHLTNGETTSCGCCRGSKGEKKISELLLDAGIDFVAHHYVNIDGKRFFFDFYVDNRYYIEYDGIQHYVGWYRDYDRLQEQICSDSIKTRYCIDNGIPLIRIPYTMLKTMTINDLIPKEELK